MRPRITVFAVASAAFAFAAVPGIGGAAPQQNRGLTIHAVPHATQAGDPVLIYGQLNGPNHSNRLIRLYHRIDPRPAFSLIQTTRTDSAGRYEFIRLRDVVTTNRAWFVRGPGSAQSRTVHEQVQVLISLEPSATSGLTRHPIVFSGHVTPDHAGKRVQLQIQTGSSDDWTTVDEGTIGRDSNYAISHAWRTPGPRIVRVRFGHDARNNAAASDPVAITVDQAQAPDFTIQIDYPLVANNARAVISGILDQPGTTTPEPGVTVQLFGHVPPEGPYKELQTTTTRTDGSYRFTVRTTMNELYQARTATLPGRHSAALFEGVQDVVDMSASSTTSTVGGLVTFTGNVSPDQAGHAIYLQKLGKDNDWHTVEVRLVHSNSTFKFGWTFQTEGQMVFRARITGSRLNVGGASPGVTVAVTQPPLSTLPTG